MNRLRQLRIDRHLSVKELADKAGVSYVQLLSIEEGTTTNPRVVTLVKLAAALSDKDACTVRPSELLMDAIGPTEAAA